MIDEPPYPVSVKDLGDFLTAVNRTTTCPYCKHDGEWTFYINDPGTEKDHSKQTMMLFRVDPAIAGANGQGLYSFAMACPKCGNVSHILASPVYSFLEKRNQDDQ